MKIAVASGKGGTGKTLIATSLAKVISRSKSVIFLDADVEAPNAHFFLKPDFFENQIVTSFTPLVIDDRCDGCGKCVEFCAYSALALVNKKILFFPELCHSCQGCRVVCPQAAIEKDESVKGTIDKGKTSDGIDFRRGILNIGEPRSPVVINVLKRIFPKNRIKLLLSIVHLEPGVHS